MLTLLRFTSIVVFFVTCRVSAETQLDVIISCDSLADKTAPIVKMSYTLVKGDKVVLRLPKDNEISAFQEISLVIDGNEIAPKIDYSNDDVAFSRRVDLKSGDQVELKVVLSQIFKIPEKWKTLEVKPKIVAHKGVFVGLSIKDER